MPEEPADHRQELVECQCSRSMAVAEIMNADIGQLRSRPDAPPGVLEIGEIRTGKLAHDDPVLISRAP